MESRAPLQAEILAVLEKRLEETRQMLVSSMREELALSDRAATSALERRFQTVLGALVSKETTEQIVQQAVDSLAKQLSNGFELRLAQSEAKLLPFGREQLSRDMAGLVQQVISPLAKQILDVVERRLDAGETLRREENERSLAAAMKPFEEGYSVLKKALIAMEEKDARLRTAAAEKEELRKRILSIVQGTDAPPRNWD